MRLIDVQTYKLHTFYGDKIPRYAILSHTWLQDHEEVTFAHLQSQALDIWSRLPGAQKVELTCRQAAQDGYSWAWVDTCCIDKSNNAELSEAINSMYRWYKRSEACYVYLMDVDLTQDNDDILKSRWWSRAWTLQELIAPKTVHFYDKQWRAMGSKTDHAEHIENATNIDDTTLHRPDTIFSRSVARRMSWAAHRHATRDEDLAYSLLGIFDINMTMQYGEGDKAFVRLQKRITQTMNDMSLFAWGFSARSIEDICSDVETSQQQINPTLHDMMSNATSNDISSFGLYAAHPREFANSRDVAHLSLAVSGVGTEERFGLQVITTAMILSPEWPEIKRHQWAVVILPCMLMNSPHSLVGLLLRKWDGDLQRTLRRSFARDVYSCLVPSSITHEAKEHELTVDTVDTKQSMFFTTASSAPSQTLRVQFDNIGNYPFEILDSIPWQKDERRPHYFTILDQPRGWITIICFHRPNSPLAVYTGFRFDPTIRHRARLPKVEVVTMALPASTAMTELLKDMRAALRGPESARTIGPRGTCEGVCGHDRVYITATPKKVFNQVVTTITLGKSVGNTSVLSRDLMCLKHEEWFFEEAQLRPKRPRRRGLLSWTR